MTSPWPLICPSCSAALELVDAAEPRTPHAPEQVHPASPERPRRLAALTCPSGHRYDAARQGYVNLLSGRGTRFTPDSAQMILARERVQDAGIFGVLSAELRRLIQPMLSARTFEHQAEPVMILDCGSGTGHYLHQLLDAAPEARGVALDLSTAGLKRAARHLRVLAMACDLWQPLPLASDSVDLLLDVFAPRNVAEYARVLRPGGLAVVVTPGEGHLAELRAAGLLGVQGDKLRQLREQMAPAFGAAELSTQLLSPIPVDGGLAADLVFMGPAGHHRDLEELRADLRVRTVAEVTVDLDVSLWRG